VRLRASGHASAVGDPERRTCLDRLAARHGLPPLEPRTFWEVARLAARGVPAARPAAPGGSAP
jgi:2-hydroxychromene-2-carboxylate isomerase